MRKRGISNIITIIILTALTIVLAVIFFSFARGIIGGFITYNGQNIELICYDVLFEARYSNGELYLANNGNIPIYQIKMIKFNEESHGAIDLHEEPGINWPGDGLLVGGRFSGNLNIEEDVDRIIFVPVLQGDDENGAKKLHVCGNEVGYEVLI